VQLLHAREVLSRVAFVSLPSDQVFVTFPTDQNSRLICDGVALQWGEILFHAPGERFHQRIAASGSWGAMSLTLPTLLTYSQILHGCRLAIPSQGRILRLPLADRRQLLQMHGQAARVAERDVNRLAHPEVARSLEQDLIVALVTSLASGEPRATSATVSRRAAPGWCSSRRPWLLPPAPCRRSWRFAVSWASRPGHCAPLACRCWA
jgi:hypothetical protein